MVENMFWKNICFMPGSLHILVASFFAFWLSRMTKIIFCVCSFNSFCKARQAKGSLRNKQNHATEVNKIPKNEVTKMT